VFSVPLIFTGKGAICDAASQLFLASAAQQAAVRAMVIKLLMMDFMRILKNHKPLVDWNVCV
jgi:hypothetical protein